MANNVDIIFQTERLHAAQLVPEDIESLFELQRSVAVMRYCSGSSMSFHETTEQLQTILRSYRDGNPDFRVWKLVSNADGAFLGNCALFGRSTEADELGYRLRETSWGQGLGREVASGLLDFWLRTSSKPELWGYVYADNVASWRILERIGFQLRRQIRAANGLLDRAYCFERSLNTSFLSLEKNRDV